MRKDAIEVAVDIRRYLREFKEVINFNRNLPPAE